MDHIFARVKRLTKKPYRKLVSNYTLYENTEIDLANCVPYSPAHTLDEDSWFKIDQFSQKPFCIDLLTTKFDSKDYDDLKKDQFTKIAYIFSVQGDDFYFQKITSSFFIRKKIIAFGEVAEIEEHSSRIIVNDQPDAVYFKNSDTLAFRNLATISGIFKGIDELYRQATQQETEAFLAESFISLNKGYNAGKVSKPNRKRIALAMDSLAKLSNQEKIDILDYISDYCDQKLKFDSTSQHFKISTDEELKLLLYGVQQRFYTTLIGKEKRLANSVQPLS